MTPKLLAISGPLKGSEFPLQTGEFAIGREPSNAIWLEHSSVSRRHCKVRVQAGRYAILDIESRNGTFVNNIPVKERELENGDEVRIGEYVFLFLTKESVVAAGPAAASDESKQLTSSIILKPEDAWYLRKASLAAELAETAGGRAADIARSLNALLGASEAIHSLRDTESISRQLLRTAFEVAPAQRGSVTLFDAPGPGECAAFGWERAAGAAEAPHYQELIEQVKQASGAIFCEEAGVIGAPLAAFEKMLGVLALECDGGAGRFDENHLQLITALGAIAGPALENSRRLELMENENRRLHAEIGFQHNMVGESAPMRAIFHMIGKAGPSGATVLIHGESGTGKELIARAIHAASRRSGKAFIAINCATLSETLMESELFGHERGAFTGAIAQKRGKLELADGGTLFLDEVGELTPALQAKLLRVLQEREFERVGGTHRIRVDIRLIAATNRDLEQAIAAGSFRRDLYYRLNVISHVAPPLRERREDIPLLANYFVARFVEKTGRKVAGISPQARAYLTRYDWPGNVRELENAIERAIVLGSSELIEPEDLPESVLETVSGGEVAAGGYHEGLMEAKKRLILGAIEQAGGSQIGAARLLGVNPTYLSRLIRNLNLKYAAKPAGER